MRNYETFRTEAELRARIDQLREQGFKDNELEVVSANRIEGDYVDNHDLYQEEEVTLGDRIAAFFTGEEPEDRAFERYHLSDEDRHDIRGIVNRGQYVLFVKRDGYYDRDEYVNERAGFVDEDIRNRDDLTHEEKIRLHEERLRVEKDRVETGEVEIRKDVVTEHQEIEVPVEREEVTIERRKVDEKETAEFGEFHEDNDVIRVPIHEERVNVEKENVVTEEIIIKKDVVHDTEVVSDDVRKERVEIDGEDNIVHDNEHHIKEDDEKLF